MLGEDVKQSEGYREGAEEDVRHRHVGDEDVPSCEHFLGIKISYSRTKALGAGSQNYFAQGATHIIRSCC